MLESKSKSEFHGQVESESLYIVTHVRIRVTSRTSLDDCNFYQPIKLALS